MDLKDFYRLILRNLVVVLSATFFGLVSSLAITFSQTPLYQSDIQLFVSTQSSAFDLSALVQGSSFSQQRVKSYSQIINSPTTLEPIIEKLKLPFTAKDLSSRVKASAPLDTVLINVTVEDTLPARSAAIANEIGAHFSAYVNELESATDTNSNPIKVSIVKNAQVPTSPSSPKKTLNTLLGLILGFGLGIGISILRQIFDNTIKNEGDLFDSPLLGTVGFDETAEEKPLISQISRYSARTEAFRQLRTNLEYLNVDEPPRVIAVSSALPGEGKSTSAVNLALSLANTGFKTLLVEADLRRPKIAKYLNVSSKSKGLSDLLTNKAQVGLSSRISEALITFKADNSIDVLLSGKIPPNPAELLNSDKFAEVIDIVSKRYQYVIVDCPPGLPVADAAIISTKCDGAIIIVEADKTKKNQFRGIKESLNNVGGHILGVVINKIPYSRVYDDYGYKYGYGYRYKKYGSKYGYKGGYGSEKNYAPENKIDLINDIRG